MRPPKTAAATDAPAPAKSLAALFRELESPLLGFAYQILKDESLAQDVFQEAFIRLQTNLDTVEQPKAWLYTTIRRLAIDQLRRARKVVPFAAAGLDESEDRHSDLADTALSPDAQAEHDERTGLMRICIERLEPRAQALVRLKFIENLSYKQIAQRLGMTVSHVGYSLHHALKSLEIELNKEGIAQ